MGKDAAAEAEAVEMMSTASWAGSTSGPAADSPKVSISRSFSLDPSEWAADTPRCQVCDVTFKWTLRRHHCRMCGRCVCQECSRTRLPLEGHAKPQRACKPCVPSHPLGADTFSISETDPLATRAQKMDPEEADDGQLGHAAAENGAVNRATQTRMTAVAPDTPVLVEMISHVAEQLLTFFGCTDRSKGY